ncbi:MAG: hypothetical protein MUP58_03400 [Candidatus Nanohaloarchaeota archaeon QJJ-9]|nr:hypothetical protein [Candidatus Nanohaloarchaeota archaeon QJJ-9]
MKTYQVWEYGFGNQGRLNFQAESKEKAVKAFLDRKVASGKSFREVLKQRGKKEIRVCVKDPNKTGTRENPNYPEVHTYKRHQVWDRE